MSSVGTVRHQCVDYMKVFEERKTMLVESLNVIDAL